VILEPNQREDILPLPVALISTISKDGVKNAASWSNITPIPRPLDDIILASCHLARSKINITISNEIKLLTILLLNNKA
jgi:flavin reductase (DIM6/NTAB) family NADH-FMN oxidoreductase RutF